MKVEVAVLPSPSLIDHNKKYSKNKLRHRVLNYGLCGGKATLNLALKCDNTLKCTQCVNRSFGFCRFHSDGQQDARKEQRSSSHSAGHLTEIPGQYRSCVVRSENAWQPC